MLNISNLSHIISSQVSNALMEDMYIFPDFTSMLVTNSNVTAFITTREDMVLCGTKWVDDAFTILDSNIKISWAYKDGDKISANDIICTINGMARPILSGERVVLNFLQTLSATATLTYKYVEKVKNYRTKIMDTRKTIPGMRFAQKYAVVIGRGHNQRCGLYDGVLIKENHIKSCGSVKMALDTAFNITPSHIPIQIEVENITQLKEAIQNKATLILLDNMTVGEISECVTFVNQYQTTHPCVSRIELEASGNISLDNIESYAKTGVDRISIGALTKNIQAIDLSMKIL